jgi:nitrite reductase (NO-forming)
MSQHNQNVYRTTPARTGKMMIILLGICLVGGVIFFSMWDYWTSYQAPVVAKMAGESEHNVAPGAVTGKHIDVTLNFIESPDFKVFAFNALPDAAGHNPTINANVGDEIAFTVANAGKSFHAFGVTKATEGTAGVIPTTAIKNPSNPLKPGESGNSKFIPTEEGTYYYICTVPGHREQGMNGEIIVGPKKAATSSVAAAPTGVHHDFSINFIESPDFKVFAFNALPGEEGHNPEFHVKSGDDVTFSVKNNGKSFHAFGIVADPDNVNSVLWNSAIAAASNPIKPGQGGNVKFIAGAPGTYYYVCTVPGHAAQGMKGSFIVE